MIRWSDVGHPLSALDGARRRRRFGRGDRWSGSERWLLRSCPTHTRGGARLHTPRTVPDSQSPPSKCRTAGQLDPCEHGRVNITIGRECEIRRTEAPAERCQTAPRVREVSPPEPTPCSLPPRCSPRSSGLSTSARRSRPAIASSCRARSRRRTGGRSPRGRPPHGPHTVTEVSEAGCGPGAGAARG